MENKNSTVNSNLDKFEEYTSMDRRILREVYLNKNNYSK